MPRKRKKADQKRTRLLTSSASSWNDNRCKNGIGGLPSGIRGNIATQMTSSQRLTNMLSGKKRKSMDLMDALLICGRSVHQTIQQSTPQMKYWTPHACISRLRFTW